MAMPSDVSKLSQREQQRMGLPEGFKLYSPFPFGGMNLQDSRLAMEDNEFYWRENFIRVGKGYLRTAPDHGASIYTASGKTIVSFFFYNIGQTNFCAIFFSDGTAVQVNPATLAQTVISANANTFYQAGASLPAYVSWGSQYLLISNNTSSNAYWVWDGMVLYGAGTLGPTVTITNSGTGYTSAPTVSFSGGSGTGATATATINNAGNVTSIVITNPGSGYVVGDTVTVAFSGGGGSSAAATVTLMPFGVSGNSIETYLQRVWLFFPHQNPSQNTGSTFNYSAPGSFTDFSGADGGGSFTTNSPFLRAQYVNGKQSNGYLYPFGDSSVDIISNVSTSGSPVITTFNYQNTDPQIGLGWRDTVQEYSRTLLFANQLGVYGLYGGAVTKVSSKLDNLFAAAFPHPTQLPGGVTPSSATADIYSLRVFLMLMTVIDQTTQAQRTVMIGWDEKEWMILSQSTSFIYIGKQEVNTFITAWGTDGVNLVPMFETPSSSLQKKIASKLYGAQNGYAIKNAYCFFTQGQDYSTNGSGVTMSVTIDSNAPNPNGADIDPEYELPISLTGNGTGTISFQAPIPTNPMYSIGTAGVPGVNLGWTFTSNSPDFVLEFQGLAYLDNQAPLLGSDGSLT